MHTIPKMINQTRKNVENVPEPISSAISLSLTNLVVKAEQSLTPHYSIIKNEPLLQSPRFAIKTEISSPPSRSHDSSSKMGENFLAGIQHIDESDSFCKRSYYVLSEEKHPETVITPNPRPTKQEIRVVEIPLKRRLRTFSVIPMSSTDLTERAVQTSLIRSPVLTRARCKQLKISVECNEDTKISSEEKKRICSLQLSCPNAET